MYFRIVALLAAGLMLTACSTGTEYRKADIIRPMDTPSDLVFAGGDPLYTVPQPDRRESYDADNDEFRVPEPPELRAPIEDTADADQPEPDPERSIETRLTRDGNDYPIIMMRTRFAWAWARVDKALDQAGLKVDDRDRAAGLFYLELPGKADSRHDEARLKLSQTANGIQVAVLRPKSEGLLKREPAQVVLERLHEKL